jgi:hypothetical protein
MMVSVCMPWVDPRISTPLQLGHEFLSQGCAFFAVQSVYPSTPLQRQLAVPIAEPPALTDRLAQWRALGEHPVNANALCNPFLMSQFARLFETRHIRHERGAGAGAANQRLDYRPVHRSVVPKIIRVDQ